MSAPICSTRPLVEVLMSSREGRGGRRMMDGWMLVHMRNMWRRGCSSALRMHANEIIFSLTLCPLPVSKPA